MPGNPGETGSAGERGLTGSIGSPGPQGLQGPAGAKGDQGSRGQKGDPGPPGLDGNSFAISYLVDDITLLTDYDPTEWVEKSFDTPTTGQFALTNLNDPENADDSKLFCFNGTEWKAKGDLSGAKGAPGAAGQNGTPGDPGPQGIQGPQGPPGGTTALEAELTAVRDMQTSQSANLGLLTTSIDTMESNLTTLQTLADQLLTAFNQQVAALQTSIDSLTAQVTALEGGGGGGGGGGATPIQIPDGEYRLTFPNAADWQSNGVDKVYKLVVGNNELLLYLWNSVTNEFASTPAFAPYIWDKTGLGQDRYEDGGPVGVALIYYIQVTGSLSNGGYAVVDESGNVGQVTPAPEPEPENPLYPYEIVNGGTQLRITFPRSIDINDNDNRWFVIDIQDDGRYYDQFNSITAWNDDNTILTLTLDTPPSPLSAGEYLFAITGGGDLSIQEDVYVTMD